MLSALNPHNDKINALLAAYQYPERHARASRQSLTPDIRCVTFPVEGQRVNSLCMGKKC